MLSIMHKAYHKSALHIVFLKLSVTIIVGKLPVSYR